MSLYDPDNFVHMHRKVHYTVKKLYSKFIISIRSLIRENHLYTTTL